MSRPHPITLSTLSHLLAHGTSDLEHIRAGVPGIQYKTLSNLVQLGHALRSPDGYSITTKGEATLENAANPSPPRGKRAKAAEPQQQQQPPDALSNQETEQRIGDTLRRAQHPLSLREISQRTGLSLTILRPSLTALVQAFTIIGSAGKPMRYRLREQLAQEQLTALPRNRGDALLGTGDYGGQELQRNPGLTADRFIAFEMPSRVGARLHWPDGRVTAFEDHPGLPA